MCCLDLETKVDRLRQDLCSIYKESGKIPDKSSWIVSNTAHVYMKSDDGPCILRLCSNESIHTMLSTDLTKAKHGNKPPKYILIEGISKMGKTFLAKKIAHCWANDKVLKDTKLLFFIYLGDPKLPKVKSGYDLIEYCISTMALSTIKAALPTVKAVMKFILDQHGKNVAFVFDALNEYPISIYKERLPQKNFITKVIRGNIDIFHESTIIITSQPVAKNALYNVVDRRIELLGVSNKEQKEYIKSTLDKLPLDKLPDEIKLENYYQYHPVIRGLCCVPCHLEAFVELLCRNCLPKTLAEMYSLFILCKPSKLKKIDDLPKRFTELAFEGLERFQFIFTVDQIQEAYPDIDDSLRAVLLQDYMHERVVFKLQIQEYLAAVYVSKLSETEREECIKNNIDQDRFKFMWIMYAAIQPEYFRYSIKQNAKKFSKKIDVNIFQCFMQTIGDEVCQMQTIEHKICQVDSSILSSCGFKSNESSWELENSKLNSIGMNSVLKYVIISKMSLNYANFSGNGLSPWGVYCAVIRHCVHESLTLCGDEGMKEYVNEIADSLRENEVLNSLTLFKIGSIGLESIKEVLYEEKGKLKEVYLSWKQVENARKNVLFYRKIFDKHGHKVDINVSYDGSIKNTLNLSSKSINDDGACLIAFGLHGNGMIRELDLSHNEITDIGAKAIIDFLKKNGTLQELNLSCNKISTIHDIVCNTSLRKLDISHNCISNCDTSLISNYSELEEINLSGNKIQFFEWNIHKTSNLRSVDFSENISSPWCVYYVIIRDCHFDRLTLYGCQGMEMYTKEIIGGLKISKLRSLTLCHTEKKIGYAKSVKKIVCRRNKIEIKGVLNFRGKTTDVNVSYNYDVKDSHKHHQYVDVSNQNLNDDIVLLITFGLYNNATVKQLDLSCSNIGDHGAVIISDCLKSEAVLCEVNLGLCLCKMNLSNNNINKMGAKGIAQALKGNRQLQELNLSGNKIQDEGAKEIAEALKDNSALQKLDISDNLISDDGVIIISNCLQSNTKSRLIQLNLLKNYNTIKGLHKILEVKKVLQKLCVSVVGMSQTGDEIPFSDNSTLHTLNVLEIDISPKYVAIIVDVVKQSRALRELSFRGTGISDSNVEIVNDCLRNSTLQVLEMPDNYISSEGMKKIVANIQNNGVLKKLDFSENYINDNGIKAVSNYLQSQSCKLQMLNLASNKITSTGARYIANAIEMNVTLQELDISYNDISDDGIEFISKRLRGLKELHISHINISDSGIRSIKDCLLNNCTLCVLDLSNNNITNDWVKIIAQSFQDNKTLKILDISKNKIDDEGIKYIRNHTLEKLNLSSNHITDIGVEMLARASWTGKLQVLDISENDIKKHEEIIACFKANTALQEIIL